MRFALTCILVFIPDFVVLKHVTGLIAFKVWKIQKAVAPFVKGNQGELSRLIAIVVESGESKYVMSLLSLDTTRMTLNRFRLLGGSRGDDNYLCQ